MYNQPYVAYEKVYCLSRCHCGLPCGGLSVEFVAGGRAARVVSDARQVASDASQRGLSDRVGRALCAYGRVAWRVFPYGEYACGAALGAATRGEFSVESVLLPNARSAVGHCVAGAVDRADYLVYVSCGSHLVVGGVADDALYVVAALRHLPKLVRLYA